MVKPQSKGYIMARQTVSLIVTVELDDVPGEFHTPESAERVIQIILENAIPHYNPEVELESR
jgi:hypothetical protein